jgi:hypothetical protein
MFRTVSITNKQIGQKADGGRHAVVDRAKKPTGKERIYVCLKLIFCL